MVVKYLSPYIFPCFLQIFLLLGSTPAHASSSSSALDDLQNEALRHQETKDGMTSLLGLASQTTIAGEVLKYLTPPDLENLRMVAHTKDHPDDTKEMKDLKSNFNKLGPAIKSYNKAFVIRRTSIDHLSRRPDMTTMFKGLVVDGFLEENEINAALAQKLDLSKLNYLEATVEDLATLELLFSKASQHAHLHLDVANQLNSPARPNTLLWKDQHARRSVSLKFITVQAVVNFLMPLSQALQYKECPTLYVYVGKMICDPKFYKPDLTPLDGLQAFFKESLHLHAYGDASEHCFGTNAFFSEVNPRILAAIQGHQQLPRLDALLGKGLAYWRPDTLADASYWAGKLCKISGNNNFFPRYVQCFALVPKHHRETVFQMTTQYLQNHPDKDSDNEYVLGDQLSLCIDFLGLFAYGDDPVLKSHKDICFKLANGGFLKRSYHKYALSNTLPAQRSEVLEFYESLKFPEDMHPSQKIKLLAFMPQGKVQQLWPVFYEEAQAFVAKYPPWTISEIMNVIARDIHKYGPRFQPGFFPMVDALLGTWGRKSKEAWDKNMKNEAVMKALIFVARLPADQRLETAEFAKDAPAIDVTDEHSRWDTTVLGIQDHKRLPVLRATRGYIFPDMSVSYYHNLVSGLSRIAGAQGGDLPQMMAVLDPILKKFQAYYEGLPISDRNGYLIDLSMRPLTALPRDQKYQATRLLASMINAGLPLERSNSFLLHLTAEDPTTWTTLTESLGAQLNDYGPEVPQVIFYTAFGFHHETGLSGAIQIFKTMRQVKPGLRDCFKRILGPYCGGFQTKIEPPLTLEQVLENALKKLRHIQDASS